MGLWRVTANHAEQQEKIYRQALIKSSKDCDERVEKVNEKNREWLDRYIQQSLQRSKDEIFQPKVDSILKL
jgi:hypothetical protein